MKDPEYVQHYTATDAGTDEGRPISNRLLEEQPRNMASFAVTPRMIEDALCMPTGYEIVGAEWDFASRTVRLFVEGPDLPSGPCGEMVRSITPSVTWNAEPDGRFRFTWDWNLSLEGDLGRITAFLGL